MAIKQIDPYTLKKWLDNNEAILIDVREPFEHKISHIEESQLKPAGSFCHSDISASDKKIVIHCQKGGRGINSCQKLLEENKAIEVYNLEGGIEAWEKLGLPVKSLSSNILPLDRQVQVTVGLFIIIFSLLTYYLNISFIFASIFLGLGMINAGLTGWCGLAKLLAIMPWNK
jgi:rhodanese-related sulfurtransferase